MRGLWKKVPERVKRMGAIMLLWLFAGIVLRLWMGDWGYLAMMGALLIVIFSNLTSRTLWLWEILATLTLFALISEHH